MQTRMLLDEVLSLQRDVNLVAVPEQNDRTRQAVQQLDQEKDGMLGTQVTLKGTYAQTDLPQLWTHQQCAEQIQSLGMVQARAGRGRLTTRRPTALKWRD